MKITLLISTYNWPEALELVLLSVCNQSILPDEILIADDGSKYPTKEIIEIYKDKLPLKHIWHEDKGFRRSTILNKTIAIADGEYIIQIDGDCILHPKFVEDHLNQKESYTFLYGSRVNIKESFLDRLFAKKNTDIGLFSRGIRNRSRNFRFKYFMNLYKKKKDMSSKIRGCNISYWRKDIIAINGYNEELIGWGRDDSEMVIRLLNKGIQGKRLRYGGIVYHIYHKIESKSRLEINSEIQQMSIDKKIQYCQNGIDKYLEKHDIL